MLSLQFDPNALPERPTVLALGAHSDDIEIGCGGTMLRLAELRPELEVTWVVLSATPDRAEEARAGAAAFAGSVASLDVIVESFRDKYLAHDGEAVRDFFEQLSLDLNPDIVLTHRRGDSHQDHRFVCELTWNTFRDQLILEYEIPKYDGDLVSPNLFIPLTEEEARRKVEAIMTTFVSQRAKPWFTEDLFMAMLRLRGMETNSPTRFAEAFTARKVVLELSGDQQAPARPAETVAGRPSFSLVSSNGNPAEGLRHAAGGRAARTRSGL
jgi:LmbE family N-acetylglucosaminyl deacetylase